MQAIQIGATGLVGKALLDLLLKDNSFESVLVITRRKTGVEHPKLSETIVDFDRLEEFKDVFQGDVLFSTLGTTLKTAGSKERQWEIDYDMQFNAAKYAAENEVAQLVLLSSAGANPESNIFYSRMKGELDRDVQNVGFEKVSILRPSMLAGDRKEFRWSEKIFTPIMYAFSWIPGIRKYRPIKDETVAKAMIEMAKNQQDALEIIELEAIFTRAKKYAN
jgi:uncharacterized protein YbjT (DUF2867 family)